MIKKKNPKKATKKKTDDKSNDKTAANDDADDAPVSSSVQTLTETWHFEVHIPNSDFILQPRAIAFDKKIKLYLLAQKQIKS